MRADTSDLHIDRAWSLDESRVLLFCGIRVTLDDEGWPSPPVDWYGPHCGHKATCKACLAAWRAAGCPSETAVLP